MYNQGLCHPASNPCLPTIHVDDDPTQPPLHHLSDSTFFIKISKLLRVEIVSGCFAPSTFSQIPKAFLRRGTAAL